MALVTVAEAAVMLRREPEVVREWLRDGTIRGMKYGPVWMVEASEIERVRPNLPPRRLTWVSWAPARTWHATREITANDSAVALCGRTLELTAKSEDLRAPLRGEPVCRRCEAEAER